ncbi:MAG: SDR family NAD(P)-dependent oxidoreductase [Bacilli bacterium]
MKILITGAASGIGYLLALTLAQRGHYVYLSCHTNKQKDVVNKKLNDKDNIKVIKLDITNSEDRKMALKLDADVLINHAGIGLGGSIIEAKMNKVRENFEVNVFSSFELLQEVLKQMINKDKGRIIIMSSLAPNIIIPFFSIYSATKASISIIVKTLQYELLLINKNVKIILIEPGMYNTGFNEVILQSKYDEGKYFYNVKDKIYKYENLLKRLISKKDLSSIVIQIVRAVEDKIPKKTYKAPLLQSMIAKISKVFK